MRLRAFNEEPYESSSKIYTDAMECASILLREFFKRICTAISQKLHHLSSPRNDAGYFLRNNHNVAIHKHKTSTVDSHRQIVLSYTVGCKWYNAILGISCMVYPSVILM